MWRRAGGRGPLLGETGSIVPREPDYDAYCIRSSYYLCRVGEGLECTASPALRDPARLHAGLVPLAEALQTNKTQLAGPCPQWTARETQVLAELHRWQASGLLT